mmetsp:Transcript_10911/g.19098  ORF Transcript_10911/g.19098 Transcript_10911/m.19098 type:complete len:214 (-) Transcript_10911:25-666(-)
MQVTMAIAPVHRQLHVERVVGNICTPSFTRAFVNTRVQHNIFRVELIGIVNDELPVCSCRFQAIPTSAVKHAGVDLFKGILVLACGVVELAHARAAQQHCKDPVIITPRLVSCVFVCFGGHFAQICTFAIHSATGASSQIDVEVHVCNIQCSTNWSPMPQIHFVESVIRKTKHLWMFAYKSVCRHLWSELPKLFASSVILEGVPCSQVASPHP